MNNLIPSHLQMNEKYDLKGSTYKRQANSEERQKESPTWKDLDFMERHPNGLLLDRQTYQALKTTVERDCRVRFSFKLICVDIFLIGLGKFPYHGLFIFTLYSSSRYFVRIRSRMKTI